MSAIVPFNFSGVPAVATQRRVSKINQEVMIGGPSFPVIAIKGKVFTLVKDNERKPLMRTITDDEGNVEHVPVASLSLVIARANTKARVFYAESFVEGESDGAKPTCFSNDGVAPDAGAASPQCKTCQLCPHAVWGSKPAQAGQEAKGTACAPTIRMAVVDPKYPTTAFLMRVPPASRPNFSGAVKLVDTHGKDYNQVVMKIGFDPAAASPKLTFQPIGFPSDEVQAKIDALYDDVLVQEIVGVGAARPAEDAQDDGAAQAAEAAAKKAAADAQAAAAAKKAAEKAAAEKAAADAAAEAVRKASAATSTLVSDDELGSALGGAMAAPVAQAKPARKTTVRKPVEATPVTPVATPGNGPVIDADTAGLLGELGNLLGSPDD